MATNRPPEITESGGACLLKRNETKCGDAIVNDDEECDCGPSHLCDRIDRCCTPPDEQGTQGCRVRHGNGQVCALGQPCCNADCKIAPIKEDMELSAVKNKHNIGETAAAIDVMIDQKEESKDSLKEGITLSSGSLDQKEKVKDIKLMCPKANQL